MKRFVMRGRFLSLLTTMVLASLASCHTAKQSTTGSVSIVGKYWKLIELYGKTVKAAAQSNREAHMILNASDKRANGNGGCNSFFGSFELQDNNGVTFSKIGATKMACPNDVMQVEQQLFQAFEETNKFTLRNDTLLLTKSDMSPLAKFIVSDKK
jgi:heat shock protein HslJ